jgi:hypothetical protein
MDILVGGASAIVVVTALVEAIKRVAKIEGDGAIIVAVIVGLAVALGAQAAALWPGFAVWWQTAIAGILLGLAACGLYDAGQAARSKFL